MSQDPTTLEPRGDFPMKALPPWCRQYVDALAHVLQVDAAMPALVVLGAVAIAIQGKADVQVRGDWIERLAYWVLMGVRSGTRKSSSLKIPFSPLIDYMTEENERRRAYQEALQRDLDGLQGGPRGEAVERAARKRAIEAAMPPPLRLFTTDATMEALTLKLYEQTGSFAIVTDEPTTVERIMGGLYSRGAGSNLSVLMHAYTGTPIVRDRVTSDSAVVREPVLSLVLVGQPGVFDAFTNAVNLNDVGFVGRLLAVRPTDTLGSREIHKDTVPVNLRDAYQKHLKSICGAPRRGVMPDVEHLVTARPEIPPPWPTGEKRMERHLLRLTPAAESLHMEVERLIEPMLKEGAKLGEISAFGAKLSGLIARTAAILHTLRHPTDWWKEPIDKPAMEGAIEIGRYAYHHAYLYLAEQAQVDEATNKDLRRIHAFLVAQKKKTGTSNTKMRVVHQRFSKGKRSDIEIDRIHMLLGELEERGMIQIGEDRKAICLLSLTLE